MTPETKTKREQLRQFIERVLAPETAVKGVVAIGSMASGHMTPSSDIDAVIFLDPYDLYIVPAEAIWWPEDDSFHSIFDESIDGYSFDFTRFNWQQWSDPEYAWPEAYQAELHAGWIAHDPSGDVARLITKRTAYPDEIRIARLDEAITWLDQHLGGNKPQQIWDKLGPVIAFDRLEAAYYYLVQLLFAYNRRWQPWRNREMQSLLTLSWLPNDFNNRVLIAANAPNLEVSGYNDRVEALQALFQEALAQLMANGDYSSMPIDQAFIRSSEEPGRAWNMTEWNKFREARFLPRNGRF